VTIQPGRARFTPAAAGADPRRETGVRAGQDQQTAPSRRSHQPPTFAHRLRIAESAVDHPRAARQTADGGFGIQRADRVGEEEQSRQGLPSDARRP